MGTKQRHVGEHVTHSTDEFLQTNFYRRISTEELTTDDLMPRLPLALSEAELSRPDASLRSLSLTALTIVQFPF